MAITVAKSSRRLPERCCSAPCGSRRLAFALRDVAVVEPSIEDLVRTLYAR